MLNDLKKAKTKADLTSLGLFSSHFKIKHLEYLKSVFAMLPDVGKKVTYFLSTGNHNSRNGIDLMQVCFLVLLFLKILRILALFLLLID